MKSDGDAPLMPTESEEKEKERCELEFVRLLKEQASDCEADRLQKHIAELEAKLAFMVDSAQTNARQRDAALAFLDPDRRSVLIKYWDAGGESGTDRS